MDNKELKDIKEYREKHPKCAWCKYYKYILYPNWVDLCYDYCRLKDKVIYCGRIEAKFCKYYNLNIKEEKNND
jgi:hypothetical protein